MASEPRSAALLGLDMADPAASVRDPALTSLLTQGWRVAASLPAQRGDRTEWLLLLEPPSTGPEHPPAVSLCTRDRWLLGCAAAAQLVAASAMILQALGG
jgi:hypothetical protein